MVKARHIRGESKNRTRNPGVYFAINLKEERRRKRKEKKIKSNKTNNKRDKR